MHRYTRCLTVCAGWLFGLGFGLANAAMTTNGRFAATNAGGVAFSVEIKAPPGTAGMAPAISINYSNEGGNGLLGIGGSLGGLSAITRCARTMYQDGARGGVNYDSGDRYCLDGQRLIAVKGADGGDGTEYRTELNTNLRVKSFGTAGSGPAWFSVESGSGEKLEYGRTADSQIEAQGKSSVAVWAVNRRQDVSGNYLTIRYTEETANGTYRPDRIEFTGNANAGTAPYNSVRFVYVPRTDVSVSYHAGSLGKQTVLLKSVDTYTGEDRVRSYSVKYNLVAPTQRSILSEIQECAGNGKCLPAITLQGAATAPNTFSSSPTALPGLPEESTWAGKLIDVNGDGLTDWIEISCALGNSEGSNLCWSGSQRSVLLNTGASFVPDANYTNSLPETYFTRSQGAGEHDDGTRLVDLNDDGLPDLIQLLKRRFNDPPLKRVFLNTGRNFEFNAAYTASLASVGFYISNEGDGDYGSTDGVNVSTQVVDLNGDGLLDLVSHPCCSGAASVFLNTGTEFVQHAGYSSALSALSVGDASTGTQIVDVNGDRIPDVIILHVQGLGETWQRATRKLALNTGSTLVLDTGYTASLPDTYFADDHGDLGTRLIDINGDGLPDLVQLFNSGYGHYANQPQRRAYLNTGRAFVASPEITSTLPSVYFTNTEYVPDGPMVHLDQALRFNDVNGDGLVDLIQLKYNAPGFVYGNRNAYLNTGYGFVASPSIVAGLRDDVSLPEGSGGGNARLLDVNGDGFDDVVCWCQSIQAYFNQHSASANYISTFTQLGESTQVKYGTITDKTLYTKDSGANAAVWPKADYQYSKYVLASVTQPNGAGGQLTTKYSYGGLKSERAGRGSLGFRWVQSVQSETGLTVRTELSQDWPYTGLPSLTKRSFVGNTGLIESAAVTYACVDPLSGAGCTVGPGKTYFPYAKDTLQSRWDLNGAVLPAIATTTIVDRWGNATNMTVTTSGGYSKTITNTYVNDETNWFLGRVKTSVVTSTTP